jgi:hypothetical protein
MIINIIHQVDRINVLFARFKKILLDFMLFHNSIDSTYLVNTRIIDLMMLLYCVSDVEKMLINIHLK